jgi:phosphatidylinositol alpha-mannosyltransferase
VRVGLVCPYSLDVPGGVQNHVLDLAAELTGRGYDVEVLAPGETSAGLPAYVTVLGRAVAVPYNGSIARVALGPRVAARTRQWLRAGRFDIVHVHEPAAPSVALLALWASEVPVVATFHTSSDRSRAMASVGAVLRPSMEKLAARIAVSESARTTLVRHLGGDPVVIPNGIHTDRFAAAAPVPDWQHPGPTVGFLGRGDEPRKGLSVLLDAVPMVRAAVPGARLLVAGGSGRVAGLDGHLGRLSEDDKMRLLSAVDVFVAPNVEGESFGIVLVEAMAAGAAVVASDLPAFRAVADGGSLAALFPVGDADGLARRLVGLLQDPAERGRLARAGQLGVARYDWRRVCADIEAVYAAVLSRPMLRGA